MKLLNQNQAVQYIVDNGGTITRQAINKWTKEKPVPSFIMEQDGKIYINVDNAEFKRRMKSPGRERKRKEQIRKPKPRKNKETSTDAGDGNGNPEFSDLAEQALVAEYKSKIYESRIKEEKSKQEEIKTAELKKELAPMYLVKHFFSFAENMVHRSFRRYHEIIPELNALFLAGKLQEAEILLNTELETIVRESQADLIKAIKEEEYIEPSHPL